MNNIGNPSSNIIYIIFSGIHKIRNEIDSLNLMTYSLVSILKFGGNVFFLCQNPANCCNLLNCVQVVAEWKPSYFLAFSSLIQVLINEGFWTISFLLNSVLAIVFISWWRCVFSNSSFFIMWYLLQYSCLDFHQNLNQLMRLIFFNKFNITLFF